MTSPPHNYIQYFVPGVPEVHLVKRSIVEASEDAIVIPAQENLKGDGGLEGVIHKHAGNWLRKLLLEKHKIQPDKKLDYEAFRSLRGREPTPDQEQVRCGTGEAVIAWIPNEHRNRGLHSKCVINTVAPIWPKDATAAATKEKKLLMRAYSEPIMRAVEEGLTSIAFAPMGCGFYRTPKETAVKLAVQATIETVRALPNDKKIKICFYVKERDSKDEKRLLTAYDQCIRKYAKQSSGDVKTSHTPATEPSGKMGTADTPAMQSPGKMNIPDSFIASGRPFASKPDIPAVKDPQVTAKPPVSDTATSDIPAPHSIKKDSSPKISNKLSFKEKIIRLKLISLLRIKKLFYTIQYHFYDILFKDSSSRGVKEYLDWKVITARKCLNKVQQRGLPAVEIQRAYDQYCNTEKLYSKK